MGEPITIKKKKKLTIKSKAAPKAAATEDAASALVLPGLTPQAPGAAAASAAPAVSYTLYAILAILATLMFIGIIVLQYFDLSELLKAFPRPIPTGM
jgi:hypothetical protein